MSALTEKTDDRGEITTVKYLKLASKVRWMRSEIAKLRKKISDIMKSEKSDEKRGGMIKFVECFAVIDETDRHIIENTVFNSRYDAEMFRLKYEKQSPSLVKNRCKVVELTNGRVEFGLFPYENTLYFSTKEDDASDSTPKKKRYRIEYRVKNSPDYFYCETTADSVEDAENAFLMNRCGFDYIDHMLTVELGEADDNGKLILGNK